MDTNATVEDQNYATYLALVEVYGREDSARRLRTFGADKYTVQDYGDRYDQTLHNLGQLRTELGRIRDEFRYDASQVMRVSERLALLIDQIAGGELPSDNEEDDD